MRGHRDFDRVNFAQLGRRHIKLQAISSESYVRLAALASPEPEIIPTIPDQSSNPLAAMMAAFGREIAADWLLVTWQRDNERAFPVYEAGECAPDAITQRAIADFSLRLAGEVSAGGDVIRVRCVTGDLIGLIFSSPYGRFTLTALLGRQLSATHARDLQPVQRFLPLLRPFFSVLSETQVPSRLNAGLAAAVESSDLPTLLLDQSSEIVFANSAADRLLAAGSSLVRRRTRLGGFTLADTLRLQAAIEHCCAQSGAGKDGQTVLTLARAKQRPLLISLMPVLADKPADAMAVVRVFDPEQDVSSLIDPVCRFYGLSPSECRLVRQLVVGASLAEAAASIGVREQTARSYLKQIFLKTETNRQAELIYFMVTSAVRVRNAAKSVVI